MYFFTPKRKKRGYPRGETMELILVIKKSQAKREGGHLDQDMKIACRSGSVSEGERERNRLETDCLTN